MALAEIDRNLLHRCLGQQPRAWEDFVDRFVGLVVHVVNHSAHSRGVRLSAPDRDDLVGEVFVSLLANDLAVLRRFEGKSSLATYLTVIARRVVVKKLLAHTGLNTLGNGAAEVSADDRHEQRLQDRDQVERLLGQLDGQEADVVRMFHLEGKTYGEISRMVGLPENSVGPLLSRARLKMRRRADQPTG